jgi:electron transfer flavoprotein alpha subunit
MKLTKQQIELSKKVLEKTDIILSVNKGLGKSESMVKIQKLTSIKNAY